MRKLQGTNKIKQLKQIAETLKQKISSHEGVSGIIFMGALTREFADKHSDLDITVFLQKKDENLRRKIRKIGSDEHERSNIDIDLEIHFLEEFRTWKWNEITKWDYSQAKIAYDPQKEIQKLFNTELKTTNNYWLKRLIVYGEYLRWYACPSKENEKTLVDAWVERGDLISAHYCLTYALTLLIRILFVINKEFLPPPKWTIYYSNGLKWLPSNYEKLVSEALLVKSLSKPDLDRRQRAIKELWNHTLPKMKEQTGLTPESISKQYVRHVLKQ